MKRKAIRNLCYSVQVVSNCNTSYNKKINCFVSGDSDDSDFVDKPKTDDDEDQSGDSKREAQETNDASKSDKQNTNEIVQKASKNVKLQKMTRFFKRV